MFPWNFSPFNKDTLKMLQQMRPGDVEKYVQEMMEKMMPPQLQGTDFMKGFYPDQSSSPQAEETPTKLSASVFQTHDDVFVRIPIKDQSLLGHMKIYHTSNQLILEHIPEKEDKQTITLPAIVKKKGAKASYKDDTLEIKFPKNIDMQFSEIDITEEY